MLRFASALLGLRGVAARQGRQFVPRAAARISPPVRSQGRPALSRAEDRLHRGRPVEHEEVDPGRAGGEELLALPRRVGDAEGALGVGIAVERGELLVEPLGDPGIADAAEPVQAFARDDRQDPGDDRHVDPGLPNPFDPVEVDRVVEEELADQELGARFDLLAQEGDVGIGVGRLRMDLGEARGADPESRGRLAAADERGELGGAAEPARRRREVPVAARRVAAEGEDVLDPGVGKPAEDRIEPFDRLPDDAQVSHRLDPVVALDPGRDLDRPLAGGARGAVGDRDEARLQPIQVLDAREQGRDALLGLRREELEREAGIAARAGQKIGNSHPRIVGGPRRII